MIVAYSLISRADFGGEKELCRLVRCLGWELERKWPEPKHVLREMRRE